MPHLESEFQNAKAYESTIDIPTYELGDQNRNPCFDNQYGIGYIYPYTLLDDYSTTPKTRTYRALHIENRYLKVTVLPELGGRVYSVYDKVSQREVFYKNSVIKFAPLALRGAFFSGGIEINFPVGHALTGTDTINWDLRENDDGSASISYGALEHLSRMRWTVTLTLFPDRCALAQDLQIQNPSPIPGRYFYWCTPACEANDQTEFVYPFRWCQSYMWDGAVSWPNTRIDLSPFGEKLEAYEGVPVWPSTQLHEPIDLHWEKNILVQVSIFGSNVQDDFFGVWQHSGNYGYAHFADHRDVSGMKHWSWGNAGMSLMTQTSLTDDGSRYAETQCGLMENQHDFDFLQPSQTYRWREWWLPLRGLEGLTCASAEVGARIKLSRTDQSGRVSLSLAVCPVRSHDKLTVKLSIPGKTLLEKEIAVRPEQPWHHAETIDPQELANHPIHLSVVDENGNAILDYTHDREVSYEPSPEQVEAETPASAEEYFNLGLSHEKLERREEAMQAYQQAISMDGSHGPSHVQLGLMHLRAADFDAAGDHFQQAIKTGQVEANFYLGTLLIYQGKPKEAESYFKAVPGGTPVSAAALCGLGCIALGQEKWEDAIRFFRQAVEEDAGSATAALLHAIALRHAGSTDEASRQLLAILQGDPLNHVAIREMALVADGEATQDQYWAELKRLLADDRQYVLDLACFYLHAGLLDEALSILLERIQEWDYPMLAYLAGDLCQKLGKESDAEEWFDRASNGNPDLVFPSRLEEIKVLTRVMQERPKDYKAKYYLANFLYAHQRFEDAIKLWEEALEGLASFDVIHRNLGMAYWKRRNDLKPATKSFEEALELNSLNQDLYLLLDDLYVAQKLTNKREALLEKILQLGEPRHDVQKRIVVILVDLGRYDQAIQRLTREHFLPLEMDQSFRHAYVRAYLERAESFIEAGRVEEAIADYQKAMEYPENVGVGRPVSESNAKILYRLGCAYESLGRFDEALDTWQAAAGEYHLEGSDLYLFIQKSLDKLNRYSGLGYC
jgi:tetratricopeptide (TPR) repeat protein